MATSQSYITDHQRAWDADHTLSVAEAIREAMDDSPVRRSKSTGARTARYDATPAVQTPSDLPAPVEPHLPLRKASVQNRMQSRRGPVPKPLFAPSHNHQLQGFNPSPIEQPVPRIENLTASSEHAFAPRENRKRFQPALSTLENQQPVLQYAKTSPSFPPRGDSRPPSSPLMQTPISPYSPVKRGTGLKSSKSMGDGLRDMRHRISNKQVDTNGRVTPESMAKPTIPAASDEIRESFRSALTSNSSITIATSASGQSSPSSSFVKLHREDWDEGGGASDIDMSVEDAIGMYEHGFGSSVPNSAKASFDFRSMRSESGMRTSEVRSVQSLQLERRASQPHPSQPPPTIISQPPTPTKSQQDRPHVAHRRSQSASILILGVPRPQRPEVSPSPTVRAPAPAPISPEDTRASVQIVCNDKPSIASDVVPRDRYGFKKVTQYVTVEQYDEWDRYYSRHIDRRTKKWCALMKSYGMATDTPIRFPPKSEKIKRYVRKGIPPDFRGAAWFWYAGGPRRLAKEPELYWQLVEKAKPENDFLSDSDREHIERDLNRTFPDNIRFKPDPSALHDAQAGAGGGSGDGSSQSDKKQNRHTQEAETPILKALRRLLQAFAIHNPNIGYCQSLNFIAGLLLLFLDEDEEKAFVLLNIVTTDHLPGTHGIALEGANVDIAVLMSCIKDTLPAVWDKLDDKGGSLGVGSAAGTLRLPTVSLATTAWFMSLFVGTLPIESVLRVWDCLFFEGSKTLFRIALSIFKLGEPQIIQVSDPMEIFQLVQTIPRAMLDINGLMEVCFRRRGGFGGVSQGLIEKRRAERRAIVKEGVARDADDGIGLLSLRGRIRRTTMKTTGSRESRES